MRLGVAIINSLQLLLPSDADDKHQRPHLAKGEAWGNHTCPGDSWDQHRGVRYQGPVTMEGMNIKPTGRLESLFQIVQIRNQAGGSVLISSVSKGSEEPGLGRRGDE